MRLPAHLPETVIVGAAADELHPRQAVAAMHVSGFASAQGIAAVIDLQLRHCPENSLAQRLQP
jgi:hypothetical protein